MCCDSCSHPLLDRLGTVWVVRVPGPATSIQERLFSRAPQRTALVEWRLVVCLLVTMASKTKSDTQLSTVLPWHAKYKPHMLYYLNISTSIVGPLMLTMDPGPKEQLKALIKHSIQPKVIAVKGWLISWKGGWQTIFTSAGYFSLMLAMCSGSSVQVSWRATVLPIYAFLLITDFLF